MTAETENAPQTRRPNRDQGLSLLGIFTAAVAIVVGAVVLVTAVEGLWILVPAMGIHLAMTAAVFAAIMHLLRKEQDDRVGRGH